MTRPESERIFFSNFLLFSSLFSNERPVTITVLIISIQRSRSAKFLTLAPGGVSSFAARSGARGGATAFDL